MQSITERVAETYRIEDDPVRSVHWEAEAAQRLRFECLCIVPKLSSIGFTECRAHLRPIPLP